MEEDILVAKCKRRDDRTVELEREIVEMRHSYQEDTKADPTHSGGGSAVEINRQTDRNEGRAFRGTPIIHDRPRPRIDRPRVRGGGVEDCPRSELAYLPGRGRLDRGIGEIRPADHRSPVEWMSIPLLDPTSPPSSS